MFPLLHQQEQVRMAERSKALRSGRSPLLWAWVRIPLLTNLFRLLLEHTIASFMARKCNNEDQSCNDLRAYIVQFPHLPA